MTMRTAGTAEESAASRPWTDARARDVLRRMFEAAVGSADPAKVVARHLPEPPLGRCVVVGAGKAAAAMAAAVEAAWPDVALSGVVVVPYGYGVATRRVTLREAAHPVPDANSEAAAREILGAAQGLGPDDLLLALISGGGSSLMALPADGLSLSDKQAVTRALLASGLDIRTMNAVRRRLSAIKGGKLAAAAAPARVVTLAISDIPGDDAAAIASGPTVPDPDNTADLSHVVQSLAAQLPPAAVRRLLAPSEAAPARPGHDFRMIAAPAAALAAAATVARTEGLDVELLGDNLEGESRVLGRLMADLALQPVARPKVLLSGGETTVTLEGARAGAGGRNTEFMLSLVLALAEAPNVWGLAADTDGEDGASGGAAGAVAGPRTLSRARDVGLDPVESLQAHDSGSFFRGLDDLLITGPTRTNVNDFRAILVLPTGEIT
jgi:hydroxypyruvate reductase